MLYRLTKVSEFPLHCIFAAGVFGDALVDAGVFLLEVGDVEHTAGLVQVHLPGEQGSLPPPPADGGDGAGGGSRTKRHDSEEDEILFRASADLLMLE